MPKAAGKYEPAATASSGRAAELPAGRRKLPAFLVTSDDSLWTPVVASCAEWVPRQIDSVDELIAAVGPGQPGVVVWDARGQAAPQAALSRMQMHSDRLAIVALDDGANAAVWLPFIERRQVAGQVRVPIVAEHLDEALARAREEIDARSALFGTAADADTAATAAARNPRRLPWKALVLGAAVVVGVLIATLIMMRPGVPRPAGRSDAAPTAPTSSAVSAMSAVSTGSAAPRSAAKPAAASGDQVDALVERAQQAMLDRRYLDPADGSALTLYRDALVLDPDNGEARQGLLRLAEILFARVQTALDERRFDVALQSLETARSIDPEDARVATLDASVASLRAELGPAQIQAALNAQNFDRAAQLIDEAARAKMLSPAKLAQLREELRRRREQFDIERFAAVIDARLAQGHLLEPRNDSAAHYLGQARLAGVGSASLQSQYQEFYRRCLQAAHGAIEQHHIGEADRLLAELRNAGAPAGETAGLQIDINAARGQPAHDKPDQPNSLELAKTRLAQGNVVEPDNDSALFYVNQLRAADPQNGALADITAAVQTQIINRARVALDASDSAAAEALLRLASGLGDSAGIDALKQQLQRKSAAAAIVGLPQVPENSLKRVRSLSPKYPYAALEKHLEGWVEIAYTVSAAGKVIDVKTLRSSPAGVFESAAADAVSRLRYEPVLQGGKAVAVATRIRVAFRMAAT